MAERPKGMGRGLAAILSVAPRDELQELRPIPVDMIDPSPNQPRSAFDEESLLALAGSIRTQGVLQPVLREDLPQGFAIPESATNSVTWPAMPCYSNLVIFDQQKQLERTDTIVLACTHYPLLLDRFERLAPWPVRWIDPAPAIARRVVELVGPATGAPTAQQARAIFTSGRKPSADLAVALADFGLETSEFTRAADI